MLNIRHLPKIINYLVVVYIVFMGAIVLFSFHILIYLNIITKIIVDLCGFIGLCVILYFPNFPSFMLPSSKTYSVIYFSLSLFTLYFDTIFLRLQTSISKILHFSTIYYILPLFFSFLSTFPHHILL